MAARKPKKVTDPTTAYARAVVAGEIVAGKPVRQACQRHLDDLEHGADRGLTFDVEAAQFALDFFPLLSLAEGEHSGKPFHLQPFQSFIVGSLFGWMGPDGFRRFRSAYVEIGKGNGKSPLAAGIGLFGLVADGEKGAEIYSAATAKDQAKILFGDAEKMVRASPSLGNRIKNHINNLSIRATESYFRPVSSEHRGLDGKRVHMALVDELHEHPSAVVVDKMRAGTKGRRQPLIFEITNSGYDRTSVCWHHHEYSLKVLDGSSPNDEWFAYVCALDQCENCKGAPKPDCKKCDQWTDESVWIKANPNLGVSITWKYLRGQVREALGMPSQQNIVKRLNFCMWTEQSERWLDMDAWMRCGSEPIDEALLKGRSCFVGVDLSSTIDMTAKVLLFPPSYPGEPYRALWHFWTPRGALKTSKRSQNEIDLIRQWEAQGYITVTEGNVVDYEFMRAQINADAERFSIQEVAYDPYNAQELATHLTDDNLLAVPIRQGFLSLSEPTKKLEELILEQKLDHGNNPVARWHAGNARVLLDAAGNKKLDKGQANVRVDGMSAIITAAARAIVFAGDGTSVYESRGLAVLGGDE